MIAVILSWILLLMVFLSFGEMAVRLWNNITKHKDSYSTTDKFWIGICLIGTILLYISIFAPLNIWVLIGITGLALAYWTWNRDTLKGCFARMKDIFISFSLLEKAIFGLIFVAILIYSLSTPLIYDEGLYHLQTMQWTEKYGAIWGLGNVHGRLGFNSSFLLLSTAFNYVLPKELLFFSINSLCLFVFAVWLLRQIAKSNTIARMAILSLVLLVSLFSLGVNAASTSTDILPNILIMYLLLNCALNKNQIGSNMLAVAFLSIFCITLKLSSVVVLLVTVACLLVLYKKGDKRTVGAILGLGVIVAVPWLVRFVILTGYLVYPFPAIDIFSVDWKIPIDMVIYEKDIAYAWARIRGEDAQTVLNMSFGEWFPIWVQNLSYYNLGLYLSAAASPILLIITKSYRNLSITLAWAIAMMGVIFGLMTAPDFRFGLGFVVCAGVIPLLNISSIPNFPILKTIIKTGLSISILGIMYIAYSQVSTYHHISENTTWTLFYKPEDIGLIQKKKDIRFDEYKLNSTSLFVPQETNQCFDHTVPCAPYYNSNLEMRGNRVEDGFRIKK